MNIFVTSNSPGLSASNLDDKRVVKMVLESTQLLCTAINEFGGKTPYRSTHKNHSATKWVMESKENWLWLHEHAVALCLEYTYIYGKQHKCQAIIDEVTHSKQFNLLPVIPITPFVNCTANKIKNISYKHISNTLLAYRLYLIDRWNTDVKPPTWQLRGCPDWAKLDNEGKWQYIGKS